MKELPTVSIEQFAGIRAALAEELALDEVLAHEGVPAWRWPELELELTERVAVNEADFALYRDKLAIAEDCLDRSVAPADRDVAVWVALLAALEGGADPATTFGLRPTDLGRLQRKWAQRFADDERLARRAAELKDAPPNAPDRLVVGETELTAFPWSPAPDVARANAALEPLAFLAATADAPRRHSDSPAIPFAGSRPVPDGTLSIEPNPEMGQTAPLSRPRPRAPATPFEPTALEPSSATDPVVVAASAPVMTPPPTRGPALEPARMLGETADAHSVREPPLPFRGRRSAPPRSALDDLEPSAALGETATLDDHAAPIVLEPDPLASATLDGAAPPSGAPLPFAGKSNAPRMVSDALEPVIALGSTLPVSTTAPARATPFEAPSRSPATWSAEDYGRFCAAVEGAGERYADVLKAWGVRSKNQHEHLAAMWRARLQADEQTLARFLTGKQSRGGDR